MPVSKAIWLYRGDTTVLEVDVVSEDSRGRQTALGITGATGKLAVKTKRDATAYLFPRIDGVVEDAPAGLMTFTIPPEATESVTPGNYLYEVEVTFADGSVTTVVQDVFEVRADLNRPAA